MRTKLTPKEVRAIALDGGEGWLVLADLAHEYGNERLARAAENALDGVLDLVSERARERLFVSIGTDGAITVAVRAARRALERERFAGRKPDKMSWEAVKAVEAGVREDDIDDICTACMVTLTDGPAYDAAAAAYLAASASKLRYAITASAAADAAVSAAADESDKSKERTLQLVDIFEVWWESVCAQS